MSNEFGVEADYKHESASKMKPKGGVIKTILIVEDEKDFCGIMSSILSEKGYRVLEANNAQRAKEIFSLEVDLIITDVTLPDQLGPHLINDLNAHNKLRGVADLPVIFISGYSEDIIASYGLNPKVVHFLPKPFNTNTLIEKVRELIGESETVSS